MSATRIRWRHLHDAGAAVGTPDAARWEPLGFPPPPSDRPWIFGVLVASANGVVAWRRRGDADDPVRAILGGDERPDRIADRRLMRYLRTIGDVGIGAQTVREQPDLVLTPHEPRDEPAPELYAFRESRGLPRHPRNVVYSVFGRLPAEHPILTRAELRPTVVTTPLGRLELALRGIEGVDVVVEELLQREGLRRAHQRLRKEHGVQYLDCEGGHTVLAALHGAQLLDEVFVTVTDVVVDPVAHEGILRTFDFEAEGATLLAEGRLDGGRYTFRRWRFAR